MSEMTERVARAIAGENADMPWTFVHTEASETGERTTQVLPWWRTFEAFARVAIEAMREPTEGMIDAGRNDPDEDRATWRNMIDEALK